MYQIVDRPFQNGWECFDIAAGFCRDELVAYALERQQLAEFRTLLAPEIKQAAVLTAASNVEAASSEKLDTLLMILGAIIDDPTAKKEKKALLSQILKPSAKDDDEEEDEEANPDLAYILPSAMDTEEVRLLALNYINAHEDPGLVAAIVTCNEALRVAGQGDKSRSLEELHKHFSGAAANAPAYPEYQTLLKMEADLITPAENALMAWCQKPETYVQYIKEYYQKKGWFALQNSFSGEQQTSMVDIAARMLDKHIVIHQHPPGKAEQIVYSTPYLGRHAVHVFYNGLGHFQAMIPQKVYTVQQRANFTDIFRTGNSANILELLDKEENPDLTGKHGETALCWAAFRGDFPLVETLCKRRSNPNHVDADNKRTPLHWGILRWEDNPLAHQQIATYLLRFGATLAGLDHRGKSVLDHATGIKVKKEDDAIVNLTDLLEELRIQDAPPPAASVTATTPVKTSRIPESPRTIDLKREILKGTAGDAARQEPLWVANLDIPLVLDGRAFTVPGNQIHIRLKDLENQLRHQYRLITKDDKAFLEKKHELATILEEAKKKMPAISATAAKFVSQLFTDLYAKGTAGKYTAFRHVIFKLLSDKLAKPTEKSALEAIAKKSSLEDADRNYLATIIIEAKIKIDEIFLAAEKEVYSETSRVSPSHTSLKESLPRAGRALGEVARYRSPSPKKRFAESYTTSSEKAKPLAKELAVKTEKSKADNVPNILVAQIGMIIELNNGRLFFISIPITFPRKNVFTVFDTWEDDHTTIVLEGASRKVHNYAFEESLKTKQDITVLKGNYAEAFYHSEQALYAALEDPVFLQYLIDKLATAITHKIKKLRKTFPDISKDLLELKKIHDYVILDFHSARYVCGGCERSTHYMANPKNPFLNLLQRMLTRQFGPCYLATTPKEPPRLQLICRASADVHFPTNRKTVTKEKHQNETVSAAQLKIHSLLCIDAETTSLPGFALKSTIKRGLHQYSIPMSGGSDDQDAKKNSGKGKGKEMRLAYAQLTEPVRKEASIKIQTFFRSYYQRKREAATPAPAPAPIVTTPTPS